MKLIIIGLLLLIIFEYVTLGLSLHGMNGGSAVLGPPSLKLGRSMCMSPPCTSLPEDERWSVKQGPPIRMEWECQD